MAPRIVGADECSREAARTAMQRVFAEWQEELAHDGVSSAEECAAFFARTFVSTGLQKRAVFHAVDDAGQFVGCTAVHCDADPQICFLYVVEERRRRGVAGMLLEHAVRFCRRWGYGIVTLTCADALVPFYQKRGFCSTDERATLKSGRSVTVMYRCLQ